MRPGACLSSSRPLWVGGPRVRRPWQRRAAARSRRSSPSTAATTWCRGRCTASSPFSSSESGACRSVGRCGTTWRGAAGTGATGRFRGRHSRGRSACPAAGCGVPAALVLLLAQFQDRPGITATLSGETPYWRRRRPATTPLLFHFLNVLFPNET